MEAKIIPKFSMDGDSIPAVGLSPRQKIMGGIRFLSAKYYEGLRGVFEVPRFGLYYKHMNAHKTIKELLWVIIVE